MTDGSTPFKLFRGSMRILTAEALALPCGAILLAVLTRQLGPANFGLYVLAVAVISWIEWTLNAFFSRASVKLLAEEPRNTAGTVLQAYAATALALASLLVLFSAFIAAKLDESQLTSLLRWFAIDIPLWSISQAFRSILIGHHAFRERAWMSAARWISRTVFTCLFVFLSPTVLSAITGWIASSLVEVVVGMYLVKPSPVSVASKRILMKLFQYAAPLSMVGLILRFFDKLDLLVLKWLGATAEVAGIFGAGQDISRSISLLSIALGPPLLATLARNFANKEQKEANRVIAVTYRGFLLLFPFVCLAIAVSPELIFLFFGKSFTGAIPFMAPFLLSAFFLFLISISNSVLTACGRAGLALTLILPLLPLSIAGYLWLIPDYGATGAANVSLGAVILVSLFNTYAVFRITEVYFPIVTFLRAIGIGILAWMILGRWHPQGWVLIAKLGTGAVGIPFLLWISGELKQRDWESIRSLFLEPAFTGRS